MNQNLKASWEEFKKELSWNNIRIGISALIPMSIGGWLYVKWINLLNPIMEKYTSGIHTVATPEQAVITLCLIAGLIFPIWPLLMWSSYGGLWLGKATKFYRDDKTRTVYFDNHSYFLRDMPQDQRDKIKEILAPYKSKYQLRREAKANQSWFRRNFT